MQFLHKSKMNFLSCYPKRILINLRKLLNIEKHSQKELLIRKNLHTNEKSPKECKSLWNNVKLIEDDNTNRKKNIQALRNKVTLRYENKFNKNETNNYHR